MNRHLRTRRDLLKDSLYLGGAVVAAGPLGRIWAAGSAAQPEGKMRFGMVTYLWGKDWDLPTLLANCERAGILGVELRTEHKHGVESSLTAEQRQDVRKRFENSPVKLVGLGTNFAFHYPDPDRVKKEIEAAKEYVKLCRDVGGSGVKVKPNDLPANVPQEKTIEQIGKSLNELGKFAVDYGQQIRLEVHGQCAPLPIIKKIMDVADHLNVTVCWNCNAEDLQGQGLVYNFNLVRQRFGDIAHVRELNLTDYPYQQLMDLLAEMNYTGWVLLEGRTNPKDKVAAMIEQRQVFGQMLAKAIAAKAPAATAGDGVQVTEEQDVVRVRINGQLFTEYNYKNTPVPYFYPVIGPTGANITRNYPMKKVANEETDHPHHRSLWFTHGAVNGQDFWIPGTTSRIIVHDGFAKIASGRDTGVIQCRNKWIGNDGKVVCTDTRTHTFRPVPEGTLMDIEITLQAAEGKVVFGDTKEGSMAIRMAPPLCVQSKVGKGTIVNSEGLRNADTWGKRAAWCDYYGPLEGQTVGVAILDHPDNPRHPTWWHVRTYGLFAVNPFGVHDFEKKPAGAGDLTIEADGSVTFRYRFYFHKGDTEQAKVAERFKEYAASGASAK